MRRCSAGGNSGSVSVPALKTGTRAALPADAVEEAVLVVGRAVADELGQRLRDRLGAERARLDRLERTCRHAIARSIDCREGRVGPAAGSRRRRSRRARRDRALRDAERGARRSPDRCSGSSRGGRRRSGRATRRGWSSRTSAPPRRAASACRPGSSSRVDEREPSEAAAVGAAGRRRSSAGRSAALRRPWSRGRRRRRAGPARCW